MPCGLRCHRISQTITSDVIIDTVPCLSYRPSSRPRPVIISYRIPDDTATQSITCDTGYDDTSLISSPYRFPPHFPLHRVAQRVGPKRDAHPNRYSSRLLTRLDCLLVSSHLIGSSVPPVACLPRPTHAVAIHLIHLISLAPSHWLIARISSPATSDETSDEQDGTARETGNRQQESGTPRHPTSRRQRKCPSPPTV